MSIKNEAVQHDEKTEILRNAIEHRATWMYFLLDEAEKDGLEWDGFGRRAIRRCGTFHGTTKFPKTNSVKEFGEAFATDILKKTFDMEVVECSEERFAVDFHYCPLVNAWMKQTGDEEKVAHLCDIAMDGDRGIVDAYTLVSSSIWKAPSRRGSRFAGSM